ncbi:MAG: hypothetical protein KTR18_15645 [Acidiferrobacterales bacterium]|nr:hypothetical protein [Acidiferrobacterales bacterium]
MSLSLKQAINQLTQSLKDSDNEDVNDRANTATEACIAIEDRMGLDFAESVLQEQLQAVTPHRSFISFINVFGLALYRRVKYDLAITAFNYRINRNPKDKIAFNNIGLTYNRLGRSRDATEAYQSALDADPDYKQAGSNLLYLQHYIWGANPEQIAEDHRAYAARHYQTSENLMHGIEIDTNPSRRLRIGFLSGDFRFHAVSRFIEGIFAELDRGQFEVFVYHTYTGPEDTISEHLRNYAVKWKRVRKMDLQQLTTRIQEDGIDILFDLAVYTQGGNPDLFAQQVAPIQINYMGYPDTSGIPALNYRITDDVSDPPGVDHLYSEKLLRLPVPLWNYTPWPNLPEPQAPPCIRNGYITFGSMNNHAKLQKEWLEVWAKVLHAVPDSVLMIKSRAINSARTGPEVYRQFSEWGIPPERIIAKGFNNRPNEHFLTFHDIDIALDTVPYCGTTTTFDSLWMGVPVVTMTGNLHVTRTSASILTGMGMTDWIAKTPEEFVSICSRHARDFAQLAQLRSSLRDAMRSTSLADAATFCSHFSNLLRSVWKDYCLSHSPTIETEVKETQSVKRVVISSPLVDQVGATEIASDTPSQSTLFASNPLLSVIVCGSNQHHLTLYRQHLEKTVGVPFEFIGINNEQSQYSLTAAYNKGGDAATTDLLVFVHDDVFFSEKSWGKLLLDKFGGNEKLGLVGLAGTALLQSRYPYWVASKAPFIHGRVIHHNQSLKVSHYSDATTDQQVVAIDGLMMATTRMAFEQHRFDETRFDGFHFYDLDFSVRVSETHEVIVTHDILVKHLSGGHFDDVWKQYRDRFRKKYPDKIWQCMEGTPEPDAHKQRLVCHTPADNLYSAQQLDALARLGLEHPKHPNHSDLSSL